MIVQFPKKEPQDSPERPSPEADIEALRTMLSYIEAEARRLELDEVVMHVYAALCKLPAH